MPKILRNSISLLLLFCATLALAGSPDIKDRGVYINDGELLVRFKPFDNWDIFYKDLKGVPIIKAESNKPELYIYYPDINIYNIEIVAHPFIVLAQNNRLHSIVEEVAGKPDMYRVRFEEEVDSASLLDVIVYDANFRGVVALSDPVEKLIQIYSEGEHIASSAVYDLDELIKVYPDVAEFKTLRAKWQAKADEDNDHKDYALVTDFYAKYEHAGNLEMKVHWLRETLNQIQVYRQQHPNGLHLEEAAQLEAVVKKKLRI